MIKTPLSTVIGGAFWTPSCTVIGGQQSFSQLIKKLFANNEQGFFYDPNDLSTMYQDAAGNIPVTAVGQPVGLMLDKSKGLVLGAELVAGGDFEGGLPGDKADGNGSVSTWAINAINPIAGTNDGLLTITSAGGARPSILLTTAPKTVGRVYELSFDYRVNSGSINVSNIYNGGGNTYPIAKQLLGSGKFVVRYVARGIDNFDGIYFGGSLGTLQIDNVSVRELKGNHAFQTTSASRPILQDAPRRIDFDTVDDKLITTLPAQLTGCTVVRSVPNVGTQILTGQTIPATYEDNKDHCGLIVINRALTPSETSAIAAEFNKRAGV